MKKLLSSDEQIAAILEQRLFEKMREKCASPQNYKFSDVVTVTEADIYEYVLKKGFNPKIVAYAEQEDRRCIIQDESGEWLTFYVERGQRGQTEHYPNKKDAELATIKKILMTNKILVNSQYKYAHPNEGLPKPSEMA